MLLCICNESLPVIEHTSLINLFLYNLLYIITFDPNKKLKPFIMPYGQIVTDKGSHLDIRLPTISAGLSLTGEYRSPRASRQVLIRRKESSLSSENGI